MSKDPFDPGRSAFQGVPNLPNRAETKVAKPLFAVAIRMAASSPGLLDRLQGSFFSQFQSEDNSLVPLAEPYPIGDILNRSNCTTGIVLNTGELAGLVHIPDPSAMPETLTVAEPGSPAPKLARQNILAPLGGNHHQGKDTLTGISAQQLSRYVAIFGGTGYGKTNLMKFCFAPLLERGYGMAVIDPKGDLAKELLDLVPEHRIKDVVWFDPTDRAFPPALNVLQSSGQLEHETLTSELMVGLKRLFHGNSEFGPRMEWILRNAVRTLLASQGEKTLHDVPRFLEDSTFRCEVLATVRDRELREFWRNRSLSQTVIDPVLNRLSSFLDRPSIRDVVSQPNKIDFHQIMREGKIFIANLEKGVLQDASFVLGSFILSRLQLAALARREGERKLFPILVDEFHNFAATGMDTQSIETFLSEARSYMAPLVVSTQYVGRLNRDVIAAMFGNVGTMICMHLGQLDAQPMQREFGDFTAEDLMDLEIGEAVVRMGPARDAFKIRTPLVLPRKSHRKTIISLSREMYCRPRSEVESMLGRTVGSTPGAEDSVVDAGGQAEADSKIKIPVTNADQWRMLEYAADHPEATVTAVSKALGFSAWRGSNARQYLRDEGLVVEVETRLGRGNRVARFLVPTVSGFRAVNRSVPSGRGGPVHKHFQDAVAEHSRTLGYRAEVESRLSNGGSVDVCLEKSGVRVAVEIAIHSRPAREYKNIRKCLDAKFDRVLCLFIDTELLREPKQLFTQKASVEERARVIFAEVGRFKEELR